MDYLNDSRVYKKVLQFQVIALLIAVVLFILLFLVTKLFFSANINWFLAYFCAAIPNLVSILTFKVLVNKRANNKSSGMKLLWLQSATKYVLTFLLLWLTLSGSAVQDKTVFLVTFILSLLFILILTFFAVHKSKVK